MAKRTHCIDSVGLKNNCLKAKTCTSTVNECRTREMEDNKIAFHFVAATAWQWKHFPVIWMPMQHKTRIRPPCPTWSPVFPSANEALRAGGKALELHRTTNNTARVTKNTRSSVCPKKLKCREGNPTEWWNSYFPSPKRWMLSTVNAPPSNGTLQRALKLSSISDLFKGLTKRVFLKIFS